MTNRVIKTVLALSLVGLVAVICLRSSAEAANSPKAASMTCNLDVVFEFRAQNGTLLFNETYNKTFVVKEGVEFIDDFSTPTRFKSMTANLQRVGNDLVVTTNWFDDVGVFDSIDFTTSLSLVNGQKQGSTGANLTHSSTPGHASTQFTLTGSRK